MKTIKFIFAALLMTVALSSCKKEDVQPNTPDTPCNCGVITDDDIVVDANGNFHYSLTIQNDCSGNLGTYYFTQDVWYNAHVGESFCVSNVESWMPEGPVTHVDVVNKEIK
jgi:hypothetical protein